MSSAIPIRNSNEQNIPVQFNRSSFAHSQGMGGISWGGASVGSWLRDEVLMATKHKDYGGTVAGSAINDAFAFPHDASHPVPSDHLGEPGAHHNDDDYDHVSIVRKGPAGGGRPSDSRDNDSRRSSGNHDDDGMGFYPDHPTYFPSLEANFCRDYTCCGRLLPTLHDLLRHYEEQHISPSPPEEPPVMRRMQNIETVSTNDVFLPFDQPVKDDDMGGLAGLGGLNDFSGMPGIDDMELGLGTPGSTHSVGSGSRAAEPAFAPPSFQPVNTNSFGHFNNGARRNPGRDSKGLSGVNGMHASGMNGSNSAAGISHGNPLDGANGGARGNVGFGAGGFGNGFGPGVASHGSAGVLGGPGRMGSLGDVGGNGLSLGDDDEPTIDDPARQLYMLERSENKPFKCPVIGCEKTYKNQNGLKYHRQHGHQNQTLHLNDDGTYSIIDPLSNTPYPDGMGMEKDKPYRCEICGKRYKNLNGLKYHRAHSTH